MNSSINVIISALVYCTCGSKKQFCKKKVQQIKTCHGQKIGIAPLTVMDILMTLFDSTCQTEHTYIPEYEPPQPPPPLTPENGKKTGLMELIGKIVNFI